MTLDDLRDAIANNLKSKLPDLRECRPHAGRFDLSELRRVAAKTPAVFVACLGVRESALLESGECDADLVMAAFVVTSDQKGLPRDVSALNIIEFLLMYVPGKQWGLQGRAFQAREVQAQNMYSGEVDKAGVAMWAAVWRQKVRLGESVWDETGVLPSHVYFSFVPLVGAEHEEDYWELRQGY